MSTATLTTHPDPSIADLVADRPALSMHAHDGLLLEGVPLTHIARAIGTPTWVISAGTLRARLAALQDAFAPLNAHVHYAVKANDHLAVLGLMREGGAGADVVSQGELLRAQQAGIGASKIVFSGVGKTPSDLGRGGRRGYRPDQRGIGGGADHALRGCRRPWAARRGWRCGSTRISMPAPMPRSPRGARTINSASRSATPPPSMPAPPRCPGSHPWALALHIGSQIAAMAPYRAAYTRTAEMVRHLRTIGLPVQTLDCGGGLGIRYRDEPAGAAEAFAGAVGQAFGALDVQLMVEPGRWLAGPAGLLLASVVLTKTTGAHRFLVLDAAMNDLVRPALYEAWHGIVPLSPIDARAPRGAGRCGRPGLRDRGHLRAKPCAAGYGARFCSGDPGYGCLWFCHEFDIQRAPPGGAGHGPMAARWAVIRPRQAHAALWAHERVPDWLTA